MNKIQEIIDRLEEIDGNGHYLNTTNLIKELKELRDEDTEILKVKCPTNGLTCVLDIPKNEDTEVLERIVWFILGIGFGILIKMFLL